MVRTSIMAGKFYERGPAALEAQIEDCFRSEFGPGKPPGPRSNKPLLGVISPHAGYLYSGPCAAWAYKAIGEARFADTYILLGLSHSGFGSSISLEDWATPFGVIKNNSLLGKKIAGKAAIEISEFAHSQEHSIEVQLPFLQFVGKDHIKKLKITPIIISEDKYSPETAIAIAGAIKQSNETVCLIASSDFTHYGLDYGYLPFRNSPKQNMHSLDKGAISFILSLKSDGFLNYISRTGATICGRMPIAMLIDICRLLGAKKGSLLSYYTSGDILGSYSSAVGYGAITLS